LLLGGAGARAQGGAAREVFSMMDTNGDGVVDIEEYLFGARDALDANGRQDKDFRQTVYDTVRGIFDTCDIDEDGFLNPREVEYGELVSGVAKIVPYTGSTETRVDFADAQAVALLQRVDADGNKEVDRAEFDAVWQAIFDQWGRHAVEDDVGTLARLMDYIFDQADIDGNGLLKTKELQYSSFLVADLLLKEATVLMFDALHSDDDNRITREEAKNVVRRAPGSPSADLATQVLSLFEAADQNDDGALDVKEAKNIAPAILLLARDLF